MKPVGEVIMQLGACDTFVELTRPHGEDFDAAWEAAMECDAVNVVDFVLKLTLPAGTIWAYEKCICGPDLTGDEKAKRIANAKALAKALYEKLR